MLAWDADCVSNSQWNWHSDYIGWRRIVEEIKPRDVYTTGSARVRNEDRPLVSQSHGRRHRLKDGYGRACKGERAHSLSNRLIRGILKESKDQVANPQREITSMQIHAEKAAGWSNETSHTRSENQGRTDEEDDTQNRSSTERLDDSQLSDTSSSHV